MDQWFQSMTDELLGPNYLVVVAKKKNSEKNTFNQTNNAAERYEVTSISVLFTQHVMLYLAPLYSQTKC